MPVSEVLLSPFALGLLGLCIGSFLNVVIHRLPLMLERGWRMESADLLGVAHEEKTPAITLSTMFAAGVPLVEALDSVGGASGNAVFAEATEKIQKDVSTGSALTTSMQATGIFPVMVLQMCAIGEESGSLDAMLGKAAEFYEDEVDEAVKGLSSLMEPFIIVILGTLIGGIVVSMYLPIFKLGQVV